MRPRLTESPNGRPAEPPRDGIVALKAELALRDDEIEELREELQGIYSSRAWRLTYFLKHTWHRLNTVRGALLRPWRLVAPIMPMRVRATLAHSRRVKEIRASELFDEAFYLRENPGVAEARMNPILHYLISGASAGRNPNPGFDTQWYVSQIPEKDRMIENPLLHYIRVGRKEGLAPLPPWSFDPRGPAPLALPTGKDRRRTRPADSSPFRVAVHVHVYYLESLDVVLDRLRSIPVPFDLFLTSDSEESLITARKKSEAELPRIPVRTTVCPNVGRDLAPLLVGIGEEILEYDLALHLHVKRSPERGGDFGHDWMVHNLECLLQDPELVSTVLSLFEAEPDCGLVHPKPFPPIVRHLDWGANRRLAKNVLDRAGLDRRIIRERPLRFPAGSMFWFRPAALRQPLTNAFTYEDFPPEPIPDDGTLAHALERSLGYVASGNGYEDRTVFPLPRPSRCADGTPEVSVVIPVLNAEKTLHTAIQSVLQQGADHPGYEVVIVDNGSTDGSLRIASFYEESYASVRTFEQPIRGTGAARNLGIDQARGDYVVFLDADDAIGVEALRCLHDAITGHDADVVTSRLLMFDKESFSHPMPRDYGELGEVVDVKGLAQSAETTIAPTVHRELQALFSDFGPCAKIYRRSFLRDRDIRFPEGVNYEDNAFVYEAYLESERLLSISPATYLYRRYRNGNGASQSTRADYDSVRDQITQLRSIRSRVLEIPNPTLRRIASESLLTKLYELIRGVPGTIRHVEALKPEIEELVGALDADLAFPSSKLLRPYLVADR